MIASFSLTALVWRAWGILKESMLARIVAASIAGLIAIKSYGYYQQRVGAQKVIERSQEVGRKINQKNQKVRLEASKPGAAKRVMDKYCRDCD